MKFPEEVEAKFQALIDRYPQKQAAIVPMLHICQKLKAREGWHISIDVEEYIAERLDMPITKVREVITFYTMLRRKPIGRHHLQVCSTLSCMLAGSDAVVEHLSEKLGVRPGETDKEGEFTLSRVECLGSCGSGPCLQVDYDEFAENLTLERVDALVEQLRAGTRGN